jgi:hypothetical protein
MTAVRPQAVCALNPESPQVKAVVEKAVRFLEQPLPDGIALMSNSVAPGAKSLIAMCLLKTGRKADHPKVQEAVAAICAAHKVAIDTKVSPLDIYNTGLCLVFLLELDPQTYRPEMEWLAQELINVQKGPGGWGYPGGTMGDTSMTQYGCLGLWAAENVGLTVPDHAWERAANWLVRTQDPSGAYGYQGRDPGTYQLTQQSDIRHSLVAAGLGSLYICSERLRLFGSLEPEAEEDPDLPPALKRRKKEAHYRGSGAVDPKRVREALERGAAWQRSNYRIDPPQWCYYYLYAYERYQSFRELTPGEGKANVDWYEDGFRFLASTQRSDGSWLGPPGEHTVADTAFGVLFLLRSTKKVIERAKLLGSGMLIAGRGLPANMNEAELRLGGVRAKRISGPAKQLLSIMSNPNDPKFEQAVAAIEEHGIEPGDETLTEVARRLRKLAEGQSPQLRAAALIALARNRNLDDVPLLIEALKDPDPHVFSAANDGLRFMSRKFYGAGFWGGSDEKAREQARKQWTEWFLSVRPYAVLDE